MATFTYMPDWGATPELTPRVRSVQFGDGYSQDAPDGLNPILPTWKLNFTKRTQAEAQAIYSWLVAQNAHYTRFDWAAPGEGVAAGELFGTGDGARVTYSLLALSRPCNPVGTPTIYRNGALLVAGVDYTLSGTMVALSPTTNPVTSQNIGTGTGSNPTFTITTPNGSAPTVTAVYRTDWQGRQKVYPTARTNRIYYSEQFDNAGWTKAGTTITANAALAPDGTNTADFLKEDSSTGTHIIYRGAGASLGIGQGYGFAIDAKAGGRTKISMVIAGMSNMNPGVVFDLATGKVTSNIGRMWYLGNGWWRCYAAGVATTGTDQNFQIRLVKDYTTESYAGDGVSGVYLWGAMTEPNGATSDAILISCEGDSISQQGQSGPWPSLLGLASPSTFGNTAVSGSKTVDMVTRYDTYKTSSRTHFAVMGGTNDVLQDVPTATTKANLSYMWADAKARGAVVVVMTIPPCQGYTALWTPTRQANLDILNAWIRAQAAANGYVLVDVNAVLGEPGNPTYLNPAYDSGDHLHPNLAGGHAIRDAVGAAILVPVTSPTSYIPNPGGTPVTVTDYSLSGSTVTFAVNPLAGAVIEADYTYLGGLAIGAVLTWTGAYTRKHVAKFGVPKPDGFNSWSISAEFREVPA